MGSDFGLWGERIIVLYVILAYGNAEKTPDLKIHHIGGGRYIVPIDDQQLK